VAAMEADASTRPGVGQEGLGIVTETRIVQAVAEACGNSLRELQKKITPMEDAQKQDRALLEGLSRDTRIANTHFQQSQYLTLIVLKIGIYGSTTSSAYSSSNPPSLSSLTPQEASLILLQDISN
jgi:hypothetical protein